VIDRLIKSLGIATFVAAVLTPIGYLIAAQRPGAFQDAFQDSWYLIAVGLLLLALGVQEIVRGLALSFSVIGAFKEHNLTRGPASLLLGVGFGAVGATILGTILLG
jgi:hypothetical protein